MERYEDGPTPGDTPPATPPLEPVLGAALLLASPRGVAQARVVAAAADSGIVARLPRLDAELGSVLDLRVEHHGAVWRQRYRVDRVASGSAAEAEVTLRLVSSEPVADANGSRTARLASMATVRTVLSGEELGAWVRVQICALSASGASFESDRRFERGQALDLALDDETGRTIQARLEVIRPERGRFGRVECATQIVAIADDSARRLDAMVARWFLRPDPVVAGAAGSLRAELGLDRPRRTRWSLRRRTA